MIINSEWPNRLSKSRPGVLSLSLRAISTVEICLFVAVFSMPAHASPLPISSFSGLASGCAAGIEISTLRAVASVESHFDPFTIRDNKTRESWAPRSLDEAVRVAKERMNKGHSVDLGLMQINNANLGRLGMTVNDAFDACRSLDAARRILNSAYAAGSSESERQAAILISLSRYNTGRALAGVANGYASQVIAVRDAAPMGAGWSQNEARSQWDIWGNSGASPTGWIITGNSSENERAGAQTSDARNEGRAPAMSSEKGEPYEVSAYRESEASQR